MRTTSPRLISLRRREAGFTLLEMLVSIAIFTIVTGAIYGLLQIGSTDSFAAKQKAEVIQNIRIAYRSLSNDALSTGSTFPVQGAMVPNLRLSDTNVATIGLFPGLADEGNNTFDLLSPVIGLNNVNPVNGVMTDEVSFIYPDTNFNGGASITLNGTVPVGPDYSLYTVNSANYALCAVGDLFLITGTAGQTIGWLTAKPGANELQFKNTDPLNINQHTSAAEGATRRIGGPLSLQKIVLVTYWVSPEGVLLRHEWGSPPNRLGTGASSSSTTGLDMPVAYFVEDFQVQYVLSDGTMVEYPDPAGTVAGVTTDLRQLVRQIRVSITARSVDVDPRSHQVVRMTVPGSFELRNLGYGER